MAEKTEEAALLAKTEGAPDNGRVLVMTDGEETLGYVVVALEDDTLVFYGFSVSGQTDFTKAKPDPMTTFVLDTLMRSAASFGETNGMNHIRTAFPDFTNNPQNAAKRNLFMRYCLKIAAGCCLRCFVFSENSDFRPR